MKKYLLTLLLALIPLSLSDAQITRSVGVASVEGTPITALACSAAGGSLQLSLDATYTNTQANTVGISGFSIDAENQFGFIGVENSTGTGRIDKISVNSFGFISSTNIGGKATANPGITQQGRPLFNIAIGTRSTAGVFPATIETFDENINPLVTGSQATATGQSLFPVYSSPDAVYTTGYTNPTFTVSELLWGGGVVNNTGATSGATTSVTPIGISVDSTYIYVGHCTAVCSPVIDKYTTTPLVRTGLLFTSPSVNTPNGILIDEVTGFYYIDDVSTKALHKRAIDSSVDVTTITDVNLSASGYDAVVLDTVNNKIYWAYTNTTPNLVIKRIDRTTFTVEQTQTFAGGWTINNTTNHSLVIDTFHRKLYVSGQQGASFQIRQISTCTV